MRPTKRGETVAAAAKDCRRSSNFAGLTFNIRKGEACEGSRASSRPWSFRHHWQSSLFLYEQIGFLRSPFLLLLLLLEVPLENVIVRSADLRRCIPCSAVFHLGLPVRSLTRWPPSLSLSLPREETMKQPSSLRRSMRATEKAQASAPMILLARRMTSRMPSRPSRVYHRRHHRADRLRPPAGYCGNVAADIETLSNDGVRAMYDFRASSRIGDITAELRYTAPSAISRRQT